MTTAKSEKAEQQSKCNCTRVWVCERGSLCKADMRSLLSAQRLELENFLLPAKRERQCKRAKESAMIPPTFATPPLPPEKAFDDTQRSIKSSISGNPPSFPPPNIGQKVALVAPKKLYQLKFALKKHPQDEPERIYQISATTIK
ncbi:uncharacterized protein LOC119560699 [Drosophila subpulchrella]|uniref:uncharacterized protein LOC119560699 n=1 Tax=Drosophila subpulchrella TaxID=1486046 RepID=UPI0018A18A67|nr:uncharacterized protein LOC119560699 [Drosophila subpulchrella]XP_037730214.1 uncharacterized protein LOC119560699 [Drosophila subpulchrella]